MPPKDPKKLAAWRKAILALADRLKRMGTPTATKRGRPKGSKTTKSKNKKKVTTNKEKSLYDKLNPNINPFAQKFGVMDAVTAPVRWPWSAAKWGVKYPWKAGGLGLGAYNVGDYFGWWGPGANNPNQIDVSNTDQLITTDPNSQNIQSTNQSSTDNFKGFDRRGGRVRRGGQRKYGGQRLGVKKMGGVPGMSRGGNSLVKINGNWVRK